MRNMRSSLVQGRLGQGPTTSVQPSRRSHTPRRRYSAFGNAMVNVVPVSVDELT
jgi:hypothetical protein